MDSVIELPLKSLCSKDTSTTYTRCEYLSGAELKELLSKGSVQFVVANVGHAIEWNSKQNCFSLWKSEIQHNLVINPERINLDQYSGGYAYLASRWESNSGDLVVLLEVHH